MRFPYVKFRGKLAPIVSVRLKGKKEWVSVDAYVDSGAAYSIFHLYVLETLGLKLEDGKKDYVTVGDGSQIVVYLHKITIEIADHEFKATIGFSKHLGIGFNVIGRLDIFGKFRICFDEKNKAVDFYLKE